MKIALFDYVLTTTNPVGGCHWRMLKGLAHEHEFTVFAPKFENPCPERIKWVKIAPWVLRRPAALMYFQYQLVAPLYYAWARLRGERYDFVQVVTPTLLGGDVGYAQFCHRAFIKYHWDRCKPQGLRGPIRWLDHKMQSLVERRALAAVRRIVSPCKGLRRELIAEYPECEGKIHIISNPVDLARMSRPPDFDRPAFRQQLGVAPDDVLISFAALGHFERKGLGLLFEGMARLKNPSLKLAVLGGEPDLVANYQRLARRHGIEAQVNFLGIQRDVRPYLWASDAFGFPSYYEAFSLAILEAAGAGLPIISSSINGVEELIRDGENGFVIEHNGESVASALHRFVRLTPEARAQMSTTILDDVQRFATENFVSGWRALYQECERELARNGQPSRLAPAKLD
jgi:glycosyltransferase involved in cell wall biosynthesis